MVNMGERLGNEKKDPQPANGLKHGSGNGNKMHL
jgi:hypothetical protein